MFSRTTSNEQLVDLNACLHRHETEYPRRMSPILAEIAYASGGRQWMEEIAGGSDDQNRRDFGTIQPGDGRRHKGLGMIELTCRDNDLC